MASVIKIKRTSVSGRVPTTSGLDTGELALNIPDKRLYTSNGTSILEIGSNPSTLSVNSAYSFPHADGTQGQVLKTDGSGNLSFSTVTNSSHTVTVNSGNTSSAGVVQSLGSLSPDDAIVKSSALALPSVVVPISNRPLESMRTLSSPLVPNDNVFASC